MSKYLSLMAPALANTQGPEASPPLEQYAEDGVPAAPQQQTTPEEPDTLDYLEDAAKGVANGAVGFGESFLNIGIDAANGMKWLFSSEDDRDDEDNYIKRFVLPKFKESETWVGKLTEGITQFAVGFAVGGGILGVAGNLGKLTTGVNLVSRLKKAAEASKAASIGFGALRGAVADFISFEGQEERLSNLIESSPELANPITEWLAADPNDRGLGGRFKNTLEGIGLGVAADLLLGSLKVYKAGKILEATPADEAGEKLLKEGIEEAADAAGKMNIDETGKLKGFLGDADTVAKDAHHVDATAVTQEQMKQWANEFKTLTDQGLSVTDAIEEAKARYGFNHDTWATEEEVVEAAKYFEAVIHESLSKKPFKQRQSVESIKNLAVSLGIANGDEAIIKDAAKLAADDMQGLSARLYAAKMVYAGQADRLMSKMREFTHRPDDDLLTEVQDLLTGMVKHGENTAKAWGEIGRTLRMGREGTETLTSKSAMQRFSNILDAMKNADDPKKALAEMIPQFIATGGNVNKMMKLVELSFVRKLDNARHELWINGLLSSARSLAADVISTGTHAIVKPLEMMAGGALAGNKEAVMKGWRIGNYYRSAVFDTLGLVKAGWNVPESSARKAWEVFKGETGEAIDSIGAKFEVGKTRAISSAAFGLDQSSFLGKATDYLGKTVRLPSRLRLGFDEFYKNISARAYLHQEALAEAAEQGLTKAQAAELFEKKLLESFSKDGRLLHEKALQFAREVTFTSPLEGKLSQQIHAMSRHPMVRPVLPFVRTPMNIVDEVVQRTPALRKLSSKYKAVMASGDATAIAELQGKAATGTVLYSAAAMLAAEGKI